MPTEHSVGGGWADLRESWLVLFYFLQGQAGAICPQPHSSGRSGSPLSREGVCLLTDKRSGLGDGVGATGSTNSPTFYHALYSPGSLGS